MDFSVRAAIARRPSNGNADDADEADVLDNSPEDELEKGVLAISTTKCERAKELWKRPTRLSPPEDGKPVLRFEIPFARIMPPEVENVTIKRFVVYDLSVRQDSGTIDPNPAIIDRRYTDFFNLYNTLKKEYPKLFNNVVFPKKVIMGNFSADLIAERSTAFEALLEHIGSIPPLRDSDHFLDFLQNIELTKACQLLDERRNEVAIPILENCFRLLNKVYMDRSKSVLLLLCRLVAACTTSPVPHSSADKWAELALRRYESVCDTDLLTLYIPLLNTCSHLWWQRGRTEEQALITQRLKEMSRKGIKIAGGPTLTQAIHVLDPRTETI